MNEQTHNENESNPGSSTWSEAATVIWQKNNSSKGDVPEKKGSIFSFDFQSPDEIPGTLIQNRFELKNLIGKGSFGKVFLAEDKTLGRLVALKVSKYHLDDFKFSETFLDEAKKLARLDHPNIVPVYDVHSTPEGKFFIVSKYLEGGTLSKAMEEKTGDVEWACDTVAKIADGLHHAHVRGLIHRDIKPGNILMDNQGNPCIVDFGLALADESIGNQEGLLGTPMYMSPEQALEEGHRVDSRSDIYSLGLILYELLTGKKPFYAQSTSEILELVKKAEITPPCDLKSNLHEELERICLKALSPKVNDRYSTAIDFAEDLRSWKNKPVEFREQIAGSNGNSENSLKNAKRTQIVYKGLRSFEDSDSDFFMDLLPGPRDRDGLPHILGFWKKEIEARENTFRVGVIYGPSGCGKSSLVKAGLIPRLSKDVLPIYMEASPSNTEENILKLLKSKISDLPQSLKLKDVIRQIRKKRPLGQNKKLLLIVDQFEQWLYSRDLLKDSNLIQALRQVDGLAIQVILLVRDDFMFPVNRLMGLLELEIQENRNFTMMDLFPISHACKVLKLFGQALNCLPEGEISKKHEKFIQESIESISVEGKVVPARLAIFADMIKSKSWEMKSIRAVGGVEGLGVQFLEEIFVGPSAPSLFKAHGVEVRKVLQGLLPEQGVSIKGGCLSIQEMAKVSGYDLASREFQQLIQILDKELRLISPVGFKESQEVNKLNYQLSHDYLVPSIKEWLLRKQKESPRGRAELLLEERAKSFSHKPESRRLPTFGQYASILWYTKSYEWSALQRKMMQAANQFYLKRLLFGTVLLFVAGYFYLQILGKTKSKGLVEKLLSANLEEVPAIVLEMRPYSRSVLPILETESQKAFLKSDIPKMVRSSIALLPTSSSNLDYLSKYLLNAKPEELNILISALEPFKDQITTGLWDRIVRDDRAETEFLRVASALASFDPSNLKWLALAQALVDRLVSENPLFLKIWKESFAPIKSFLVPPLKRVLQEKGVSSDSRKIIAANILADYVSNSPEDLADLIMNSDEALFAIFLPVAKQNLRACIPYFELELDKDVYVDQSTNLREKNAARQANAAVFLMLHGRTQKVWPLFKHGMIPSVRSFLIHRVASFKVNPSVVLARVSEEKDVSARRALYLLLGEYDLASFQGEEKDLLIKNLQNVYKNDPDPGIHSSVEWLLKTWDEADFVETINQEWAKSFAVISTGPKNWMINSQGQTLVKLPLPGEFMMGSPTFEQGNSLNEKQHKVGIPRSIVMANKPVTLDQFEKMVPGYRGRYSERKFGRSGDLPVIAVSWFEAAKYCNWLNQQENIPEDQWCYEIKGASTRLKTDYLSLKGYRLPTEAEMEFAIRSNTTSARFYGDGDTLLEKYAWYLKNSQEMPWPVGSLKPNDFGLFDVLGNCWCWCNDAYKKYPDTDFSEDREFSLWAHPNINRIIRGGGFYFPAPYLRSSYRENILPTSRDIFAGFRVVKTIDP